MMEHFTKDWNNSFLKEKIIWFFVFKTIFVNPLPPKTSGKQRLSNVFRVHSNRDGWNVFHSAFQLVIRCLYIIYCNIFLLHFIMFCIFYHIKHMYILRYFHVYICMFACYTYCTYIYTYFIHIIHIIFYISCTTHTYTHISYVYYTYTFSYFTGLKRVKNFYGTY